MDSENKNDEEIPTKQRTDPSRSVYVSGISRSASERQLFDHFQQLTRSADINMTGLAYIHHMRMAFIEYANAEQAQRVVELTDGSVLFK